MDWNCPKAARGDEGVACRVGVSIRLSFVIIRKLRIFAPANTFDYKTFVNGLKNGNHATKGMRRAVGEQSRERHPS